MKISGIICEYNPLHNGHLYHLEQVRQAGADGIVAVMSGNFVQRGDAAILDKFTRARLAIQAGVDLVIELPVPYALAPAENFAMGGVALLTALGNVQELSFGSECGDITLLSQAADACQVCKTDYADVMEDFLRSGYSYPEVLSQMVAQIYGKETADVLRQPNNTLAIAYLNAIAELRSPLQPMTIQRKGAAHNSTQPGTDGTASATYIRQFFAEGGDCRRMMPSYAWHALHEAEQNGHVGSMEHLERLILYKLRTTDVDELRQFAEVGQGLEHRLYKAKRCASLTELLQTIQTKRYPMARLRRILLHMLLDIRTEDIQQYPSYGRILAFNDVGREILRDSKNKRLLPFSHSLAELARTSRSAGRCAALESQSTDIYQLSRSVIGKGESDFRRKITISRKNPLQPGNHER
jgi:predicted nucleotidyltransferase